MGKFVVHGTLIEEPRKSTIANGTDCMTLVIEEKYKTSYKEVCNVFSIDFIGKSTNCVPTNVRLAGAPVVVMGSVTSRQYNGKYYYDLKGEQLSIITTKTFTDNTMPTQADINNSKDPSVDAVDVSNDDLPF